jgi:hypothetical protein
MPKFARHIGIPAVAAVLAVVGLSAFAIARPAVASSLNSDLEHGGRRGLCGEAGLAAAADALSLTPEELHTQMRAGESLADLADEAGVEASDVLAAVDEACTQATRDAIEQAVTDGDLTREKADWLLEGLDNGYWGPSAGGGGIGFGPRGGHGPQGGRGNFGGLRFETNPPAQFFGLGG